jgi:hypothetical protein
VQQLGRLALPFFFVGSRRRSRERLQEWFERINFRQHYGLGGPLCPRLALRK